MPQRDRWLAAHPPPGLITGPRPDVAVDELKLLQLPALSTGADPEFAQFRKKAEHFLKEHLAESAVAKVRSGEPLTAADLADLQRILVAAGIGDDDTFAEASAKAGSFGRFVRSLVGLDRVAAKAAFAEFLDDKRYSKNQIKFVTLIIDELTEHGVVDAARVYESPYDSVAPTGPEALFPGADLDRLFATINALTKAAATPRTMPRPWA